MDLFGEATLRVIRLSLDDSSTCLTIFEPLTQRLTTFVKHLSPATLAKVNRWTAEEALQAELDGGKSDCLSPTKNSVSLPHFQISSTTLLQVPLQRMGFCEIFGSSRKMDGYGKTDLSTTASGKCMIDSFRQKVAIGTGGTTVNKVLQNPVKSAQDNRRVKERHYRVKRPFVFFVEHLPTNTVLLAGIVFDPSITQHSEYPKRHFSYVYPPYKFDRRWTKKRKAVKQWLDKAMK